MLDIRPAELGDLKDIAELFQQLGYSSTQVELSERLLHSAASTDDGIFVAEIDDHVQGIIVINYFRPFHAPGLWAKITALVVDESVRSTGIGAALLTHAEHHARAIGCVQIELSSNTSRTRAHQFYARHGYVETPKRFVLRFA